MFRITLLMEMNFVYCSSFAIGDLLFLRPNGIPQIVGSYRMARVSAVVIQASSMASLNRLATVHLLMMAIHHNQTSFVVLLWYDEERAIREWLPFGDTLPDGKQTLIFSL